MTPERLDAIRERVAKATVGPWDRGSNLCAISSAHRSVAHVEFPLEYGMPRTPDEQAKHDAAFIRNARQDIPDLLAALTAAKAENETRRLLQELGEDLAWRSYLGIQVLQAVLKKSKLDAGADISAKLLTDIAAQYPHFPAKSALRPMPDHRALENNK